MLVGSVVVHDDMQVEFGRRLCVDLFEEADEFLMPMPRRAVSDHLSVEYAEGCKQSGRTVAFVVVRVIVPQRPLFNGRPGWVRSRAWIWLFSSTHRTRDLSGDLDTVPRHRKASR